MTEEELSAEFSAFGGVASATIIRDKETNKSRGFGFVIMESDQEAKKAIEALNGKDLKGRPLTVNEARPRTDNDSRPPRGERRDRF